MKLFSFHTRLATLPVAADRAVNNSLTSPESQKKRARIDISLEYTSQELGFLHATLVQIGDQFLLLAGPSGVGKSTLAKHLTGSCGAKVLANDWVAVEKENGIFYASDLNTKSELKHTERCRIDGLILLTEYDALKRDAFIPSDKEYARLIRQSFDAMSPEESTALSLFWIEHKRKLPFYCVVPTREGPPAHTAQTFIRLLKRMQPKDAFIEVGIIGVGEVGSSLAAELGQLPFVHRVHLYNRSKAAVVGLALDLNQALYRGRSDIFVAHDSAEDLFIRSSSVFLTFRDTKSPVTNNDMPERWKKLETHRDTVVSYAAMASTVAFEGTLFVITNPVDFLTYIFYDASQKHAHSLRTFQVYGIGLEGDVARAVFYGARYAPNLDKKKVHIYGNHADDFVLKTNLQPSENEALHRQVKDASSEIRSHAVRTVHGPVSAAVKTFEAFSRGGTVSLTGIQQQSFIGRRITFRFGLPALATVIDDPHYDAIIANNKRLLQKYASHL